MQTKLMDAIESAGTWLRERLGDGGLPRFGAILGSGLGPLADRLEDAQAIPYTEIPDFLTSTVEGHKGRLVVGTLNGTRLVAMQGRFHMYEGYEAWQVTFPVRVLAHAGMKGMLVTNAAGGVNGAFSAGDLMVISDHLNLTGRNPLIGPHDPRLGARFPDMSQAYDPTLREVLFEAAEQQGLNLQLGVYAGLSGPCYETPAEVRMLRTLGADAVGMSTVPEVIVARQMGVRVAGMSLISNMAAGIADEPLSHQEVMETADRVAEQFGELVRVALPKLDAALGA